MTIPVILKWAHTYSFVKTMFKKATWFWSRFDFQSQQDANYRIVISGLWQCPDSDKVTTMSEMEHIPYFFNTIRSLPKNDIFILFI